MKENRKRRNQSQCQAWVVFRWILHARVSTKKKPFSSSLFGDGDEERFLALWIQTKPLDRFCPNQMEEVKETKEEKRKFDQREQQQANRFCCLEMSQDLEEDKFGGDLFSQDENEKID